MNPPPLLVSFSDAERLLRALSYRDRDPSLHTSIERLVALGLPPGADAVTIGTMFGFSTRFVMTMANRPAKHYRQFNIHAGKKTRAISSPKVGLKAIQSWLGFHLCRAIKLPDCVHGFVPGKSTISAAKLHLGAEWVLSIDIRDFFPSTSRDRVQAALSKLGYPQRGCEILSRLMTLHGALPQGSPASPALANLCFENVDVQIAALASDLNATYTRYADDLVISASGPMPTNLVGSVSDIVVSDGWTIAEEKTRIKTKPNPLRVHGILVHGRSLRLPKKYRNAVRMMQYALRRQVVSEDLKRVYLGHISYASAVYGGQLGRL